MTKETKKQRKKIISPDIDILFPDFRAVSYLMVDICGVSKLTGILFFLLCTSVDSIWRLKECDIV